MPITTHAEDILPNIQTTPNFELMGITLEAESPALVRDISGCVSLIGPVQVCYDVNISTPSASIALKVFGTTIISGEISPDHPCLTFKGSYGIAKWDLNVCLRLAEKKITLEGSACAFSSCKSFDITLFSW